jgi:hypothetical protein
LLLLCRRRLFRFIKGCAQEAIKAELCAKGNSPETNVGFLALVSIAIKAILNLVLKISPAGIKFKASGLDFN